MIEKLTLIFKKYREQITYLFFGGLTTLVSWGTYTLLFYFVLTGQNVLSNVISEAVAITFAYITNKIFVFRAKSNTLASFLIEMLTFYGLRIAVSFLNVGAMYLFVDILKGQGWLWKIIVNVVIIIINYVFSKLLVFKKGSERNNQECEGAFNE